MKVLKSFDIYDGKDHESYYNPLYIELDECGENVRVYEEVKRA